MSSDDFCDCSTMLSHSPQTQVCLPESEKSAKKKFYLYKLNTFNPSITHHQSHLLTTSAIRWIKSTIGVLQDFGLLAREVDGGHVCFRR
jgi:hypothetical protein